MLGSATSWYLRDLRRAAESMHAEVEPVPFSCLSATVKNGDASAASRDHQLADFDAIIVRSMPPGSLEQVVFRMDVLQRCEAAGQIVLNPARSLETAIDKYLCLAKLQSAGFDIPATWCGQSADQALQAFEDLDGDVVLKPLFGGEGRGITRINDLAFAMRSFRLLEQLGSVIYLQKFIPHAGSDYRLLVVGDELFGIRRENKADWRTNISLGATAHPLVVTDRLAELARLAGDVIGAPICALDLLPGKDGRLYGLEVNAVPGWKALANVLAVDIAEKVISLAQSLATTTDER